MIIDIVSDLHGHYPKLEGGDLLIVAGDWTAADKPSEVIKFGLWLFEQKYERKVFIAGNHDNMIQTTPDIFKGLPDFILTYLCDSGTEFEYEVQVPHPASTERVSIDVLCYETRKLKIWGSPWTLAFKGMNPHCKAFTVETEEELAQKWALIPDDTDILITHSPPHGCYLDQDRKGTMLGSISLRDRIYPFTSFRPRFHVFGHIHEGYGKHPEINPNIVNASHVNEQYMPVNKPIRVTL